MRSRTSVLIGILLAVATGLFVWGSIAERSSHSDTHVAQPAAGGETHTAEGDEDSTGTRSSESGETPAQHNSESPNPGSQAETGDEAGEFRPLGVSLETNGFVALGAVVSLALAGLVAFRPRRRVLVAVAVIAAGLLALEVVEVVHQIGESRPILVLLAAVAGVLHGVVAVLAVRYAVQPEPRAVVAV